MQSLKRVIDMYNRFAYLYDELINDVNYRAWADYYFKIFQRYGLNPRLGLDLGCGTGLELDEIFKKLPDASVTGIDLTQAMLDRLKEKHPDKSLNLICGDYFSVALGEGVYDCAVSFQTMHHFSHEKKTELYRKICKALKSYGVYIECDYMVEAQEEEDFWFAENERIRKEQNIPLDEFFHYDTPCTVDNQIQMLKDAGFSQAEKVFRIENTTIIVAKK